jgi:DNA-binding transcriptional regulator YdaS (Cro superfamily)
MASALKVTQPTVSEWHRGQKRVPAERCPEIERGTRERNAADPERAVVTCEELRPDVAWEVLRLQTAPTDQPASQGA